jgi:hypothetical protein
MKELALICDHLVISAPYVLTPTNTSGTSYHTPGLANVHCIGVEQQVGTNKTKMDFSPSQSATGGSMPQSKPSQEFLQLSDEKICVSGFYVLLI